MTTIVEIKRKREQLLSRLLENILQISERLRLVIRIKKKSWNQDPWVVNKIVNKEKQFRKENESRERNAISKNVEKSSIAIDNLVQVSSGNFH